MGRHICSTMKSKRRYVCEPVFPIAEDKSMLESKINIGVSSSPVI